MARRFAWTGRCACRLGNALLATCLALGQASPARADADVARPPQPEGASTLQPPRAVAAAAEQMVAAANPLAAQAGLKILRDGGSAVDAAIAVQMVLTLVEPQSSGIGGGAFLVHWDGHAVQTYDGRETAPQAASEDMFLDADGRPLPFFDAAASGLSVGVPGVMRMLERAHHDHGRLPWASLFAPAVELAQEGFPVSPRLHALLQRDPRLKDDPAARRYFYDEQGHPLPAGAVLKNPALAQTLRALAFGGTDAFYGGTLAADMVRAVRSDPHHPGRLSEADLRSYRSRERAPVCGPYRRWSVCGMGPPSSGGVAVAQVLGILSHFRIGAHEQLDGMPDPASRGGDDRPEGQPTVESIHWITEAERLAFADRDRYLADPDFVPVNLAGLLDPNYLAGRARLIGPRSMGTAQAGSIQVSARFAPDRSPPRPATSHLSIVDRWGNAVAMTTSIEMAFGAHILVDGFLLNNQLTDFSFEPTEPAFAGGPALPVANRVQPGKRPLSTMAPTLVFDRATGQLVACLGSPGGTWIVSYVVKALAGLLDWQLDPQQAVALPNFGSRNGPTELEAGRFDAVTVKALQARGHKVVQMPMTSGVEAIIAAPPRQRAESPGARWLGGSDPRREGVALGD